MLDFGTGTGCLAIALAVKCPGARVVALDVSMEALDLARTNAVRHKVEAQITFVHGDGVSALPDGASFDLVAGNPPYIPSSEIAGLQPEVRNYDPHAALDGGADGLEHHRHLAREAGAYLRPGGKIMLEFGDGQEERLAKLFEAENWIVERIATDYTQRPRLLIARRTAQPSPV